MTRVIPPLGNRRRISGHASQILRFVGIDLDQRWMEPIERIQKSQTLACSSRGDLAEVVERADRDTLWIIKGAEGAEKLVRALVDHISGSRAASRHCGVRIFGDLLMLEPPSARVLPTLLGLFSQVMGESRAFKKLPMDQLMEVLGSAPDRRREVFLGGTLSVDLGTLTLVRGDLVRKTVPLTLFRPSGKSSPDFSRFELDDFGQTLRFGNYEATSEIVLWETDPDYRMRSRARERAEGQGFGASLRRLRKQRGLSQDDFPQVARKTISRIEKGEVAAPHGITLKRIAATLGVSPEELETY